MCDLASHRGWLHRLMEASEQGPAATALGALRTSFVDPCRWVSCTEWHTRAAVTIFVARSQQGGEDADDLGATGAAGQSSGLLRPCFPRCRAPLPPRHCLACSIANCAPPEGSCSSVRRRSPLCLIGGQRREGGGSERQPSRDTSFSRSGLLDHLRRAFEPCL